MRATDKNQVSTTELGTILDQEMPIIDETVIEGAIDQADTNQAEGTLEQADTTTVEKEAIILTEEQIDEINILAERLLQATDSATIIATMADISKLHRRISKPIVESQVTIRADGTKLVGATTTIQCTECGQDHIIKVQDQFQVKKCPACQKIHRNAKRAEKRKDKRAELKAIKDADKVLADKLLAEHKAKMEQAEAESTEQA